MANHTPPIVPHVLYVAEQHHPWKLAPIERLVVRYSTPTTVATEFGSIDFTVQPQKGRSGVTKQQREVWCVPDDAAWQRVQACRAETQQAIDLFADYLRLLGSYATRLEQAGGIKKARNPLCPTTIIVDDPDSTDSSHFFIANPVPRIFRSEMISAHTPKMLTMVRNGKPWGTSHQRNHFVCPSDDHWTMIEQRRQDAQQAYEAWQQLLRELGTYQDAIGDGRYSALTAKVQAPTKPTAALQPADTWHELPPALAGWHWATTPGGEASLLAPDGWSTKSYRYSNKAIAEALRRVNSRPKAPAALVPAEPIAIGVAMMDAAEAREALDGMRADLGQADLSLGSFRRRALEFADRQGWKALGYTSSAEAINTELGEQYSKSYVSRLLNAARIERLLELPMGNGVEVPERTLRPLGRLDTPEQQKQAWQAASAAAAGATPTAGQVQQAVDQLKPKAAASPATPPATMHPDYQAMAAIEQILAKLDQWADSARPEQIHAAYGHARALRDPALRTHAFALIDRALDATAAAAPQVRGAPHKPVFVSIHDEMDWLIGRQDWAGAQALIDGLPGGAMGVRTILARQLEKGRAATAKPEPLFAEGARVQTPDGAGEIRRFDLSQTFAARQGRYLVWLDGVKAALNSRWYDGIDLKAPPYQAADSTPAPHTPEPPVVVPPAIGARRPQRPASADVSATLTYLDQLEAYADAQDTRIAELERRLAAPIRWIRVQLATCRLRLADGTADEITAAELEQLAEDLEELAGDDSLSDAIYESLARQIRAAQEDLRAAQVGA